MSAEGDIIVEEVRERTLSDDSEELVTLVKIAGLKVHLKNECRKRKISMRNVKSNRLELEAGVAMDGPEIKSFLSQYFTNRPQWDLFKNFN